MKILLAEDDVSISVVVKLALEKIGGHKVEVASDGNLAFQMAVEREYDLIILDGMMPGKDGMTVCHDLKKTHKSEVPIIFLSAKSQESDIMEGMQKGAIGYIQKPFDPKTINIQIQKIVDNYMGKVA